MAKRSLRASQAGAKLARKIYDRRGWTQENLAAELDLRTRQPIWRFFTCRPIERHIFIELCTILDLNWWEIAEQAPESLQEGKDTTSNKSVGLDQFSQLVEQIRLQCQERIEHQCGTLRVLGTGYPVPLADLYVSPSLVGRLASQDYLAISDLENSPIKALGNLGASRLADYLTSVQVALETYSKLRILGKPGGGKTSLLKYVALQCSQGKLQPGTIPVFVKLGSYVEHCREQPEFSLLHCIQQEFLSAGILDLQSIEMLLNEGKILLLLDELDEISELNSASVFKEISRFFERYYKSKAVIACRLNSQKFEFLHFTDFEIADFNDEQVAAFAERWFSTFARTKQQDNHQANEFIQQVNAPENQRVRELVGNPLLFNRICQTFLGNGNLFENRPRIYEECLNLLLWEWDEKRGIQRTSSTPNFTPADINRVLTRLAASALEEGRYFFEKRELEQWIEAGARNLPDTSTRTEGLKEDEARLIGTVALQQGLLLEQARGIFSFSYIAFQEYLTFKQLFSTPSSEQSLMQLLNYAAELRWHEVFLLTCSVRSHQQMFLPLAERKLRALVTQNQPLAKCLNDLGQRRRKLLLHRTVTALHALLSQWLSIPHLAFYSACFIPFVCSLAQKLLLEILLDQLVLWIVTPRQNLTQASREIKEILEQAIALARDVEHEALERLLLLREQLLQHHSEPIMDKRFFRCSVGFDYLKGVLEQNEMGEMSQPLTVEQIQSLRSYLYAVQLFSDCLNCGVSTSQVLPPVQITGIASQPTLASTGLDDDRWSTVLFDLGDLDVLSTMHPPRTPEHPVLNDLSQKTRQFFFEQCLNREWRHLTRKREYSSFRQPMNVV